MKRVIVDAHAGVERLRVTVGGDVEWGPVTRSEGGVQMTLVDPVLSVEADGVDFRGIHGDILLLIAVLAFHPVLPEEPFILEARFPVSVNIQRALDRAWILPGVEIQGSTTTDAYAAARDVVLSYGGGIDSLAAHLLFPGVPLVHESPLPSRRQSFSDVVNEIIGDSPQAHVVFDNLRQLFTQWGLPLWTSVYVASLIFQPRWILSGSEMTGTYLMGGQRYHPRYQNLWYRVFSDVGVGILPTSFLSEIGNARIVSFHQRIADAAYCQRINTRDCDACTKCLRRRMIRGAIDPRDLALVDSFRRSPEIETFLERRPLYYGDVFVHAAASQSWPTWVNDHIGDLLDRLGRLPFHDRYYPGTFEHFNYPDRFRSEAESGLKRVGIPPFDEATFRAFEEYVQLVDS